MSSVRTIGFEQFKSKINNLPEKTLQVCGAIVYDEALKWAGLASRSAPRNKIVGLGGSLVRGIRAAKTSQTSAEVTSQVFYSPYVEWGTGTKVSVPQDLIDYAIRFKGQRKVIGMNPQAFFFIHKGTVLKSLQDRITAYLTKEQ